MSDAAHLWPGEPPTLWDRAMRDVLGARSNDDDEQYVLRADVEYQSRPADWISDVLGVRRETLQWSALEEYGAHEWDGDPDPLLAVLEALATGDDVAVESATGTGKTFLGACIVLWFLACFEDSIVITAAPKEDQLLLHIWKEIGRMWPRFQLRFPQAKLLTGKIRMRPAVGEQERWAATAFVCGVGADETAATKAQGFHAEHMLIVTEETPGIHPAIMVAFDNTRTDDHNLHLAFGNPDHQDDELHRFALRPDVRAVRISALDHPNIVTGRRIVPGAIGRARLEQRRQHYGEDSPLWLSRGRGISPAEAQDALIKRSWCEAAVRRYSDELLRVGPAALGIDVANSENGDRAAIARGKGAVCLEVESFPCPDASKLGVRVVAEARIEGIEDRHVGIDSVGVGASTVNKSKELGHYFLALNGGSKAISRLDEDAQRDADVALLPEEVFANLRAQMWWQARLDLQHGRVGMPNDAELIRDLTTPKWETRGGKILVEPKEKIRERLGRSPDKGDAFVEWNWVRRRLPVPEDEPTRSAWDPELLEAEMEKRRVTDEPELRRTDVHPALMVEIE